MYTGFIVQSGYTAIYLDLNSPHINLHNVFKYPNMFILCI